MTTQASEVCRDSGLIWLTPGWPAPAWVCAGVTTRIGGTSLKPYDGLNLASHVGDDIGRVVNNRRIFMEVLKLPSAPIWLNQVHGIDVINAMDTRTSLDADGMFTMQFDQVCLILTADCLPVLLTDEQGSIVAAVHAGWRGLLNGVLDQAVVKMGLPTTRLLAWLGPAISGKNYQVGDEVYQAFLGKNHEYSKCFTPTGKDQFYQADLYAIARQILERLGLKQIYGGNYCTFGNDNWFYSYRRSAKTGRFASFIYLDGAKMS